MKFLSRGLGQVGKVFRRLLFPIGITVKEAAVYGVKAGIMGVKAAPATAARLAFNVAAATAGVIGLGYLGYRVMRWALGKGVKGVRAYQEQKKKIGIIGAALPG